MRLSRSLRVGALVLTLVLGGGSLAGIRPPEALGLPSGSGPQGRALLVAADVPAPPGASPLVVTKTISGSMGGRVVAGRFQLDFPPNAFTGSATVTVRVPVPSLLDCSLEISPNVAQFRFPVRLTVDGAGCPPSRIQSWKLATFVEGVGWVDVGSVADAPGNRLTAQLPRLSHSCIYDSKAGW
jgi:hypothetical protein